MKNAKDNLQEIARTKIHLYLMANFNTTVNFNIERYALIQVMENTSVNTRNNVWVNVQINIVKNITNKLKNL